MRLLLPACLLGLSLLSAACGSEPAPPDEDPTPWRGEGRVLRFDVPDISCTGCVSEVQKRLATLPGVEAVQADADSKEVRVTLREGASREDAMREIPAALAQGTGKRFTVKGLAAEAAEPPDAPPR